MGIIGGCTEKPVARNSFKVGQNEVCAFVASCLMSAM